jgi:GTPase SAR1 family protein
MGLCASENLTPAEEAARERNRELEKNIGEDEQADAQVNKLLLLGAGGSGKSTMFKQMISIYGKGFSPAERKNHVPIIYNNVIVSMKVLLEQSATYGSVQDEASKKIVDEAREESEINEELGSAIQALWADVGIQATYDKRSKFQLNDSTKYFMDQLEEIKKPDYAPSEQDILRSRVPTTGIVENSFEIDKNQFKMFDVGGQRSERKKWINCFEDVTAVLFVASISAFDQVLYEDESQGRMHEALILFEEITNSEWFDKTAMILFLNKEDLFRCKLEEGTQFKDYFPEYSGANTFDEVSSYITDMFENQNHKNKDIYSHLTCATDTNSIFAVFNDVKDIIIKQGLEKAGLM